MKRHQSLVAALNEYAIMLDVCKRNGDKKQEEEIKSKMKEADY